MAVAGGAQASVKLQVIDRVLCAWGDHYRLSTELVSSVEEAMVRLERGEIIMYRMYGDNLPVLKRHLAAQGIDVTQAERAAHELLGTGD